jgi:hypothetical protein
MSVADFVELIDSIINCPSSAAGRREDVRAFLDSDVIHDHVLSTTLRVLAKARGQADSFQSTENENPSILFDRNASDGIYRRLVLKSEGNSLPFHSTFPNDYAIIPLTDLLVDHFRITGHNGADIYSKPHRSLRLELVETHSLSRGDVLVRTDAHDEFDVRLGPGLKYLILVRGRSEATYQLIFARDTRECVATSMTDVPSTKAIAFLEILENIRSENLADIAHDFTNHYSPIVRWRALSSMNKISHSATTDVLHRFSDDSVAFVREAARKVLAKGRV